jgi:hypothetical protein
MSDPSIVLRIALETSTVSQLESIKVKVTLENQGPPATVPSLYDQSGALAFTVRAGAQLVRFASGLTQQEMMTRGRLNPETDVDELGTGQSWSALLDLGQATYAPPPGQYQLVAHLLLPSGEPLHSNEVAFTVSPDPVLCAAVVRDNPVIDGLALLLQRSHPGEPWLLRQYNTAKPLGAWYGEGLPIVKRPAVAQRAFFSTQSFDHFFERWVVASEGVRVVAEAFASGRASGAQREAPLPPNWRLLDDAVDLGGGAVDVFAIVDGRDIVCASFEPGALRERWRMALPDGAEGDPRIAADPSAYWLAVPRSGLAVARVDRQGAVEPWEQRFNTDLRCATLFIDPVEKRILASFWDAAHGQHLQMVQAETNSAHVSVLYRERQGPFRAVRELAFDCDRSGEFHVLASCDEGLFYSRHDQPPAVLAPAAPRRSPIVSARPAVHLGFYDAERGYHFYEFKRGALLYRDPQISRPG